MTEWKKYTGSDEQIAEMLRAEEEGDGYILRYEDGTESERCFFHLVSSRKVTHYLICNPHPLAGMICKQARTGQQVWYSHKFIKASGECGSFHPAFCQPETYEYSFTEFKGEV